MIAQVLVTDRDLMQDSEVGEKLGFYVLAAKAAALGQKIRDGCMYRLPCFSIGVSYSLSFLQPISNPFCLPPPFFILLSSLFFFLILFFLLQVLPFYTLPSKAADQGHKVRSGCVYGLLRFSIAIFISLLSSIYCNPFYFNIGIPYSLCFLQSISIRFYFSIYIPYSLSFHQSISIHCISVLLFPTLPSIHFNPFYFPFF